MPTQARITIPDSVQDVHSAIQMGRAIERERDELEAKIAELEKKLEEKPRWQTVADAISAYRVFPRLAIVLFGVMTYDIVNAALHSADTGYQDAGLASIITVAFSGALSAYMGTGKRS